MFWYKLWVGSRYVCLHTIEIMNKLDKNGDNATQAEVKNVNMDFAKQKSQDHNLGYAYGRR